MVTMATAPFPLPIREDTVWPCGHGYQEAVSEQDDIEPSGLGVPRDKFKNEIFWVLRVSPHKTVHSEVCLSPRWSLLSTTSQPIQVSKGNSHSVLRLSAVQSTTPWTVLVRPGLIYGDQNTLQTYQRDQTTHMGKLPRTLTGLTANSNGSCILAGGMDHWGTYLKLLA